METLIIFAAKYLYIFIVLLALIFFVSLKKEDKVKIIYLTAISAILAALLALLGNYFINDPRPFAVDHVKPLIAHTADNGFPSDHTLVTMLAALLVLVFNRKVGLALAVLSVLVGVSRILARVHHPLDILGSIIIAAVSVTVAIAAAQKKTGPRI